MAPEVLSSSNTKVSFQNLTLDPLNESTLTFPLDRPIPSVQTYTRLVSYYLKC